MRYSPETLKKRQEYSRLWRKKHPERVRALNKDYRARNLEKCRLASREYYRKNKKRYAIWHQTSYQRLKNDPERMKEVKTRQEKRNKKCINSWASYFPKTFQCNVCGKELFLTNCRQADKVCFDHNYEYNKIKHPATFLKQKICNPKNIKIWEDGKFGTLCNKCNLFIPTKNRIAWLKKVTVYVTSMAQSQHRHRNA